MTQANSKINTYAENALLTKLSKSEWTGKIKASDLDSKIAIEHNAQKGRATKTDKLLISKDEPLWKAVKAAGRKVHAEWERWSCPWQDGGTRMIASARFIEFSTRLEEAMTGFNKAVAAFVADYEKMIPRQAERLGKLFDPADYPTASEIVERFGVSVDYYPVPTGDDFRVQLADDQMDAVRQSTQRMVEASIARAAKDPIKRLHKAVATMVATLGQSDKIFRDSLITNVRELAEMMPALNIANDPKIDELTDEIQQELATIDPSELRDPAWKQGGHAGYERSQEAQAKRSEAKDKAAAILGKLDGLLL